MMLFLLLLKGLIIFGIAIFAARYLEVRSADLRARIWTLTFTGLFIIAAVPFLLPDVSLPVWTVPAGQAQEVQATGFNASQSIPPITIAIWTWRVGVAFFLSWLAIQFVRLELKRRRATPCSDHIQSVASQCGQKLGLKTLPDIYVSSEVRVPLVFLGLRGMNVLMPASVAKMSESRLESTLLHELSHVHRRDVQSSLLSAVVCALYWVIPFAWWSAAKAYVAREEACDQLVLSTGIDRYRYADDLLESAREIGIGRHSSDLVSISSAMATANCFRQRIEALLRGDICRGSTRRNRQVLVLTLLLSLPVAFSQICYSLPADDHSADAISLNAQ
jgi:beta-lactamase regulating signal transducer with metallopeptidase domain